MRNTNNINTTSAALGDAAESENKITIRFKTAVIIRCIVCLLLGFVSFFSDMRPFSLGFYTALFSVDGWMWLLVSGAVGLFAADAASAWVYCAGMVMVTVVLAIFERRDSMIVRCVAGGLFFALFKLARIAAAGLSAYAVMAVVLELIILEGSIIVSYYGYPVFINHGKRNFISSFERLCTFAFTAFVILSLGGIEIYERISLSSVAAILCIYILCSGAGVENATVFGTVTGVVTAMSMHPSVDVAGIYAFGALVAAAFSKHRKPGVIFGFMLASTAFSLLVSDYNRIYSGIVESIVASLIYAAMPNGVISRISSAFSGSANTGDIREIRRRIRKDDFSALKKMADSFRALSDIYLTCGRERGFGRGYVVSKMNAVSKKVCAFCPSQHKCFDCESEQGMKNAVRMFEKCFENGRINTSDMPSPMRELCHRKDSFADAFNSMMEVVLTEKVWLSKTNESRRLIGNQLSSVADAIEKICESEGMHLNPSLEETLRAALDKCGVFALGISAYTDSKGDFCIYVSFREGYVPVDAVSKITDCIDKATYTKSGFVSESSDGTEKTYLFCPQCKYTATFGYASKSKHGEKISGDSFNVIAPDRKNLVMALSDGMGCGPQANEESRTAIMLLEKFLNAGFDSDTAIRLINSSLLLKSAKDSFATVDICTVNLRDHTLVFTKLGAANAYIKSKDGVSVVRGKNLPAGILKEIDIEKHMLPIDSDTIVVMVSDGVGDTAIRTNENEGWIEEELRRIDSKNPQIIAARIMECAYRLENNTPKDDMTVLVACISDTDKKGILF